jgi:hypothetical protein
MKIIITEKQYRYILENEEELTNKPIEKNLLEISVDEFLSIENSFIKAYKKKGYDGLKLYGDLNFYSFFWKDFDKFFEHVIEINGNIDLRKSTIKSLGRLEKVIGYVDLDGCKELTDLGNLKYVDDYLNLNETQIKTLGNLEHVGKSLYIAEVPIEDLSKLKYVGGDINLWLSKTFKSLGDLEKVGGYLNIKLTNIESLGKLIKFGDYLDLTATKIKTLGNLEYVGGNLYISDCKELDSFGELKYVGGGISMRRTPLSEKMNESDVKRIINVKDEIYL